MNSCGFNDFDVFCFDCVGLNMILIGCNMIMMGFVNDFNGFYLIVLKLSGLVGCFAGCNFSCSFVRRAHLLLSCSDFRALGSFMFCLARVSGWSHLLERLHENLYVHCNVSSHLLFCNKISCCVDS